MRILNSIVVNQRVIGVDQHAIDIFCLLNSVSIYIHQATDQGGDFRGRLRIDSVGGMRDIFHLGKVKGEGVLWMFISVNPVLPVHQFSLLFFF